VRFNGDELETLPGGHVVLKPMCKAIGVDAEAQRKRLLRQSWAGTSIMEAPDARGHRQEHFCLHVTSVHMWLATIDANRVKPEVREKLDRYQREAALFEGSAAVGIGPQRRGAAPHRAEHFAWIENWPQIFLPEFFTNSAAFSDLSASKHATAAVWY
jgi:hypothetical protein